MSLIHTCELCRANEFDYLTQLRKDTPELNGYSRKRTAWNNPEILEFDAVARARVV